MNLRASYDSAARAYADHLGDELRGKPLDRHLLDRYAEAVRGRGRVADLGCGPGHVTAYLHDRDVDIFGVDLSPEMVREATRRNPGLEFRVADFTASDLPDAYLAGIVAFYSIVHLQASELGPVLAEWRRIVAPGGAALFAFHTGEETVHVDELWGVPVSLDFCFHPLDTVVAALETAGFAVTERIEREPYRDVEYESRRGYLFARAL